MRADLKIFLVVLTASIFLASCTGKSGGRNKYGKSLSEGEESPGTGQPIIATIDGSGYYNKTGFCNIVGKKAFAKIYKGPPCTSTSNLPVCDIKGIFNVSGKEFQYSNGDPAIIIPDFIVDKFPQDTSINVSPFEAANIIEGLCFTSLGFATTTGKGYTLAVTKYTMNKVAFTGTGRTGEFSKLKVYLVLKALKEAGLVDCTGANDKLEKCKPNTTNIKNLESQ